jgi:hypothetical protein
MGKGSNARQRKVPISVYETNYEKAFGEKRGAQPKPDPPSSVSPTTSVACDDRSIPKS